MHPPVREYVRSRRLIRTASTVLLALAAVGVGYLGIGIALLIVSINRDAKAVAGAMAYLLGAFGVPIAAALYLSRRRNWNGSRAVRLALILTLLVHAGLLPIALAVFAM